ncbi:MAG: hypothetical protein NMK33_00300 [Candidatus Cardinium sp.]|uniref:hypothetical protein n=1 Tax=Cardinium endosymbiont of Dermatophagoides farinae TaxID=2597823 RepID=UPI00164338E6|nr:hypothetical protein [Cardinium endosymbiont of Dermatophagoides farinae]UWW97002.1 MAG: hypothetical protein NMK33_00300 [Candidatus Cardinium sp.]
MPVKINELVIQVKVYDEAKKQVENVTNMPTGSLLHTTTEQKALAGDVLRLLEEQKER